MSCLDLDIPLPLALTAGARFARGMYDYFPAKQLEAAAIITKDYVERSKETKSGRMTERCAGYWAADGTISRDIAQRIFQYLYETFDAHRVSSLEAAALGYPVRWGKHRGAHWQLPNSGFRFAEEVLEELTRLGCVPKNKHTSYDLGPVRILSGGKSSHQGRKVKVCCPEHNDHEPSALVNEPLEGHTLGNVFCFACGRIVGRGEIIGGQVAYQKVIRVHKGCKATVSDDAPTPATGALPAPILPPALALLPDFREEVLRGVEVQGGAGGHYPYTVTPPAFSLPFSYLPAVVAGDVGTDPVIPEDRKTTGVHYEANPEFSFSEPLTIPPQALGLILAKRQGDRFGNSDGFFRGYSACMDLIDLFRSAQHQAGEKAWKKADDGCDMAKTFRYHPRLYLPDLYSSLDYMAFTDLHPFHPKKAPERMSILQPTGFRPTCTKWVGVDVDGIEGMPSDEALSLAGQAIGEAAKGLPDIFTGRIAVVKTSEYGVQVTLELLHTRWDPSAFYKDKDVQKMLTTLDAICLDILREHGMTGGIADPSIHSPGRYVRRPGPRVDKRGEPYVSRLVYSTPDSPERLAMKAAKRAENKARKIAKQAPREEKCVQVQESSCA